MSRDDHIRRVAEGEITNNPYTQNRTPEQLPNYQDRQVFNNELDRIRREEDERARRDRGW